MLHVRRREEWGKGGRRDRHMLQVRSRGGGRDHDHATFVGFIILWSPVQRRAVEGEGGGE